jgi:curved DNA-binding protein CbpA
MGLRVTAPTRPSSPAPPPRAEHGSGKPRQQRIGSDRVAKMRDVVPQTEAQAEAENEPDAAFEIDLELQKKILDLHRKLDGLTHFQVLELDSGADRKAVKKAYFAFVGTFHPDRYYKKKIGHFTRKIERIFQRLTEAHDTLSDADARKEYEQYLAAQRRTRALDIELVEESALLAQVEQLLQQAQDQARKEHQLALRAPSVPPPVPVTPKAVPKAAAPAARLVDDPAARRRALARKLGRAASPSSPPPAEAPPAPTSGERHAAAADDLKRRYERRMQELQRHQIDHYIKVADAALAAGKPVSALNALRIAAGLAPADIALAQRISVLDGQVATSMADAYLEQARYEANQGHHLEAGHSYTRAARGKPHPDTLQSAVECYLKANAELRQAGELARQAVAMAPERSDLRLTLARVYEAAGMKQSVAGELQRVLELTPDDAKVKEWLKRIERGGV